MARSIVTKNSILAVCAAVVAIGLFYFGGMNVYLSESRADEPSSDPKAAPRILDARRIRLVDEQGRERVKIDLDGVTLFDADGKKRASFQLEYHPLAHGSPTLAYFGPDGDILATLSSLDDGTSSIQLIRKGWNPGICREGPQGLAMTASPDGQTSISLLGTSGSQLMSIAINENGLPQLEMYARKGNVVTNAPGLLSLGVDNAESPAITLRDNKRRTIWSTPSPD